MPDHINLFQKFDIWPIILRIVYSPHHVDLAALSIGIVRGTCETLSPGRNQFCGQFLLTGSNYLGVLQSTFGVELQLKHVHAVGVYGWGSVCETIIGEWLVEISQNQNVLSPLPSLIHGSNHSCWAHDILLQAECILTGVPSAPVSSSLPGKTKANVSLEPVQGLPWQLPVQAVPAAAIAPVSACAVLTLNTKKSPWRNIWVPQSQMIEID
ncbi:hypothetical protein NC653_012415 [Populus alba x Populus x berolinensis]|uniref:Autophagy-related protein 2 n=1 Tax=Populus alba x Populus x berolinensis TaxID=444605 RepID=A0AAD6R636_9ROSI|nr:hypothetical protein NC653_012415 [Populus alba x Populus x berolinensis]